MLIWYVILVCGKTYWAHCETATEALNEVRQQMTEEERQADFSIFVATPVLYGLGVRGA